MATLARTTRDLERAEEAVQAAYLRALERWPVDGIPDDPAAWIYVVARNAATDAVRRSTRETEDLQLNQWARPSDSVVGGWPDDRLALVFACCHPALAPEARVALTLRHVGGLTTAEVARAFLATEGSMRQRLTRARRKVRDAGIAFEVPGRDALEDRLASVLATLYLVFTTGYARRDGAELSGEAIRLAKLLAVLAPGAAEARGLLALMLLQESRRPARWDADGALVLLGDQDRARWDTALIAEGRRVLRGAGRGRYALQARIAGQHVAGVAAEGAHGADVAPKVEHVAGTDWAAVAALYEELGRLDPSPVIRLNGAVAIAEAHGPAAGLQAVEAAGRHGALDGYHLFHAARGELLARLGDRAAARAAYERALRLADDAAEQAFLRCRLAEV